MRGIKKENERKKNQGRRSEEGIIQIIFWKNIPENKTTFSNRQLYNSSTVPVTFWDALIIEAALEAGASFLLSEDLSHGQTMRGLTIQNPFIDLNTES